MIQIKKGPDREILLTEPALFKFHRYLLLFSHNRSYSTLLCHILGSHPQICGYIEALMSYETAVDLIKLNCEAFRAGNYRSDCDYVVDKLLYDCLTVSDIILRNPRVTPIFIIREPEAAVTSLVRMKLREHELGMHNWGDLGTDSSTLTGLAADYYVLRLNTLQALSGRIEALGSRGIFLPAESLMDDTAATFRLLERALGLDTPLSEEYTVFRRTGKPGSGDTSSTIRSGRIVRDRPDSHDMTIPAELLERVRQAYDEGMDAFRRSPALMQVGE